MIPYTIHQIWMNPQENGIITSPPEHIEVMMNAWKNDTIGIDSNVGHYKRWNEVTMRQFVSQYEPDYVKIYDSLQSWIVRCDVFRFIVLYHLGGLYIDADSEKTGDLRPLLNNRAVLVYRKDSRKGLNNFFLAAQPGMTFFRDAFLKVNSKTRNVFEASGPWYLTQHYFSSDPEDRRGILLLDDSELPLRHYSSKTWILSQISMIVFTPWVLIMLTLVLFLIIGLLLYWCSPKPGV